LICIFCEKRKSGRGCSDCVKGFGVVLPVCRTPAFPIPNSPIGIPQQAELHFARLTGCTKWPLDCESPPDCAAVGGRTAVIVQSCHLPSLGKRRCTPLLCLSPLAIACARHISYWRSKSSWLTSPCLKVTTTLLYPHSSPCK